MKILSGVNKNMDISVSPEDCELIESLQFELNGYKNLLDFLISGSSSINNDNFKNYHQEYLIKNTEYETAKDMLATKYLGELKDKCNWNLDFTTHTLTAEKVRD